MKTTARRTVRSWLVRVAEDAGYLTVLQCCSKAFGEARPSWAYNREFFDPSMADLQDVIEQGYYTLHREEGGMWRYELVNEHF